MLLPINLIAIPIRIITNSNLIHSSLALAFNFEPIQTPGIEPINKTMSNFESTVPIEACPIPLINVSGTA